ncbi:MAG: CcmD family protein [Candidatus Nitrospinota bacterium M3_3B_026]
MSYVIAAYAIVWLVFFAYVFYLGRKITGLERELSNFRK